MQALVLLILQTLSFQECLPCRHSIHATSRHQGELRAAAQSLPKLVQGTQNVYHCAYHSEASYGAASYLVTRQEGNVLFDSPRFDPKLLRRIQVGLQTQCCAQSSTVWCAVLPALAP